MILKYPFGWSRLSPFCFAPAVLAYGGLGVIFPAFLDIAYMSAGTPEWLLAQGRADEPFIFAFPLDSSDNRAESNQKHTSGYCWPSNFSPS